MQKYSHLVLIGAAIVCAPLSYSFDQSQTHRHSDSDTHQHLLASYQSNKAPSAFDVLNDDNNAAYDHHEQEEQKVFAQRLAALKGATRYSCQLISSFSQCRQYPIDKSLKPKLKDLKESCESLPLGQLKKEACPTQGLMAQCQHIQLDYHDAQTFIYDNYYYSVGGKPWDKKDLARICSDLEGRLVAVQP